jgi:hypothetical protein
VVLLEVAVEIAYEPSFATSVEVAGEILVDNAILGLPNDAPYIHLSILKVLFHKKMEHHHSGPNLSDSSVSDTSVLPTDATTNHRRRRSPRLSQGQRRPLYEAAVPLPEVPETQLGEAEGYQFVPLPLPLLESELKLPMPKALLQKVTFSFCCLLYPSLMPSRLKDNPDFF